MQMAMEMIEQNKKYLKKRINEIIDDYLFDKDESYCRVQFWFEKFNGEHQEKTLAIGKPSNKACWTNTDETVWDAKDKDSGQEFEISIVTSKCSACGKWAEQVNRFTPHMSYEYCPHCGVEMKR
jgi:hypothetical protein